MQKEIFLIFLQRSLLNGVVLKKSTNYSLQFNVTPICNALVYFFLLNVYRKGALCGPMFRFSFNLVIRPRNASFFGKFLISSLLPRMVSYTACISVSVNFFGNNFSTIG